MQETTQVIYGKTIHLKSNLPDDKVAAVIKRLNKEMDLIGSHGRLSYDDALLMAALNITECLLDSELENRQLADILDDDAFSDTSKETET